MRFGLDGGVISEREGSMGAKRAWRARQRLVLAGAAVLTAAAMMAGRAGAAQRTWIGGNADWVDLAGNSNWNPSGEPTAGDDVIFNTPNTVRLGSNNNILTLALSNGIDLHL